MEAARAERIERLCGCYVTVPTLFRDGDLAVDTEAIARHVSALVDRGITTSTGVLLAGGAAGDFTTLSLAERSQVAEAVVHAAAARVPVAVGAQTTSTAELIALAHMAVDVGAEYVQVSPPFYFAHTEGDFLEHVRAIADLDIGVIVYNTYWTSSGVSSELVEELCALPNVVGLKWSTPDTGFMEFEQAVSRFASRLSIIDNQLRFVTSHMLGARSIEVHVCNYWPEWGVRVWQLLESKRYPDAQDELFRVAMPFMALWQKIEQFTSGDGYLDKLCMELVGLGSSRCRPPTRDVRDRFREEALQMLIETGVPNVDHTRLRKPL